MKKIIRIFLLVAALTVVACAPRERELVLLSTNDMHAQIQNFPRLAAAVEACRDTAQLVVLVDAGDRVSGNAFVDRVAMPGLPIVKLMNDVGYDVATLGNHEFDHGVEPLAQLIDSMRLAMICANVKSETADFPQLPPYVIIKRAGLRIGFVGVVTNYEGAAHPAGNERNFVGLSFPDPQQMAAKYAAELRPKCDLLVLVSHMGDNRDLELLTQNSAYDLVIGGHTHVELDTLVGATRLTQSGKNLKNIGATVVRFRGKKIQSIDYRVVPLADYAPNAAYQQRVDGYYADPELNRPVGSFAATANKWGVANWMARLVAEEADAEIGIYHIGGVRLDSLAAGNISTAVVYGLEPFGTHIARMRMTPAAMRRMIISKYNDPRNIKEGHRIDLITTVPYEIVVDGRDQAIDVRFPTLTEGRAYLTAASDYVYNNYNDLEYTDGELTDDTVVEVLLEELADHSPVTPDNTPYQRIRRP
ncbi:MAG: bifunctional UDP-sugar hydrolase/5'-nucleotidase [Alistipes sp.]